MTPHAEGRVAKAIRTAKRPDASEINAVMPRAFAQLEDVELKAIWTFLKTVPAAATGAR